MLPKHINFDSLKAVLDEKLPNLSNRPSDSARGFLEVVLQWIDVWWERNRSLPMEDQKPFAFIQQPESQIIVNKAEWKESLLFRESYSKKIGGSIHKTTTPMLAVFSSNKNFENLEDLGAGLSELDSLDLATLIVEPANKVVHYCPHGISVERITLSLDGRKITSVTSAEIDSALEQFHREHTQYPEGYTHCFDNRKERILRRDSEAMIRDALYLQFKRDTFGTQLIAREEQLTVGRPDISIYDKNHFPIAMCVFELKVLRSRGTTRSLKGKSKLYDEKTMIRHARMGTSQVLKYRTATSAELAYLVCFDGRDNDVPQEDIEKICTEKKLISRRYYMETSTRDDL